ncbi:MAG: glycoside hydrolase family 88 protein [Woeseiaceae bacterium]|jgi:unsaturated rhamnogalacturonyl hydrolase
MNRVEFRSFLVAIVLGLTVVADAAPQPPARLADAVVHNLLARDYMYYGDEALHYAEAAAAVGALRHAAVSGNDALRARIVDRYRPLLDAAAGLVSWREHVDMAVIGILPLEIAMQTGDEDFRTLGLRLADAQWADPLDNGLTRQSRWWIDDLYMIGMLQMQAYRATGETRYADRAARQLVAYLPEMQHESGLFYHSPDAPIFWGRGNGWVAAAMIEVLRSMPADHPLRATILTRFDHMMHTLLRYQSDNGMWRQVVDYPYSWAESSATAMFAYAMAAGINEGLLDADEFAAPVRAAWRALRAHVDRDANLREVCVGTGKENDLEYYLKRPRVDGDLHGQAPLLWLAVEMRDFDAGSP